MILHAEREVPLEAATLRALVLDPAQWSLFPGIESIAVEGSEVQLALRGPRRLSVRVELRETEEGAVAELVEGDLRALHVEVRIRAVEKGAYVVLDMDLQAPYAVPGPLLAELEQVTLARWLGALGG
ncbi:MAG: hypothetical protein EP330_11985 [Deltaproteobacteria bacterium]|nr:MAG: hypothetical protein EP330_11985 [Deltaproteobacteria bacterium]